MTNLYQILGLEKSASADDIKRAYKKLAVQNHPDKGGDEKKFQEISNAYDVLSDPKKNKNMIMVVQMDIDLMAITKIYLHIFLVEEVVVDNNHHKNAMIY